MKELAARRLAFAAPAPPRTHAKGAWISGLFHLALAALLVFEVGLIRARFDTDRFLDDGRVWTRLLLETRHAAPIGIAVLAAWVLIGWQSLVREYQALAQSAQAPAASAGWLGMHLVAFLAFERLTQWTFHSFEAAGSATGLASAALWGTCGLVVAWTAAASAFRPRALASSAAALLPSFLLATFLGLGAFLVGRIVIASGLWYPLLGATAWLARGMLALFAEPALLAEVPGEGFTLSSGGFAVLISHFCSGFEGIALTWTFLFAYLVWFRHRLRFPHALVLVPVATVLVWLLNGLRLAALVWIGEHVSGEVALAGFHSYAGWIAFCGLTLSVVYTSQRIPWFARDTSVASRPRADTVNPAWVYLAPFLGILAISFATGAVSTGFDRLYPLRVVVGALLLWQVSRELPSWRWRISGTGLLYGVIAFVIWVALERLGVQPRESGVVGELARLSPLAAGTWLAFRVLGFLLVAPLAEELAFRGFLTRRLARADFESLEYRAIPPFAWAASSLAFGLLHQQWIAGTLAGALFGLALLRRGRLGDAVVAHATTNALLLASSLTLGPWHAWI